MLGKNKALDSKREARNIRKFFALTFLSFKKNDNWWEEFPLERINLQVPLFEAFQMITNLLAKGAWSEPDEKRNCDFR